MATLNNAKVSTPSIDETVNSSKTKLAKIINSGLIWTAKDIKTLTNAEADSAIASIRATGKSLRDLAHKTACGIMMHYVNTGDFTKMQTLHSAISDSMSKAMATGLVDWVKKFSSLRWNPEKKEFYHVAKKEKTFNLTGDPNNLADEVLKAGALNQPFWSQSFGDRDPHTFDLDAYMAKVMETVDREIDRLTKATTKREQAHFKIDMAKVEKLKVFAKDAFGISTEKKAA